MYQSLIRPILFKFPAEKAHHLTFAGLKLLSAIPFAKSIAKSGVPKVKPTMLFGLEFPNPIGLAAGLDKNALLIDSWEMFGFGFIELGTITPLAQDGNPQPRLFRIPQDKALINRMGFNNDGMLVIAERLKNRSSKIIVGGNIGKNKVTPNEEAASDYVKCFNTLYPYVDYFVLNVSSPNTPGLRALQEKEPLLELLNAVQTANAKMPKAKPILLKIAPDLTEEAILEIVEILHESKLDGVIATNTTIDRTALTADSKQVEEIGAGGLSGAPLTKKSTEVVRLLRKHTSLPIIASGGVMTADDAMEKFNAGANLVQLYTGFIYEGPSLVKQILRRLPQ
jgi:dihydroorotate dehydrogenase